MPISIRRIPFSILLIQIEKNYENVIKTRIKYSVSRMNQENRMNIDLHYI